MGKHFPSLGLLCCHFPSEAADCPSSPNTETFRHQRREPLVSYHHACYGRLKPLTPQGTAKGPGRSCERGLALLSWDKIQTTKPFSILPIVCENVLKKGAQGYVKTGTRGPTHFTSASHTHRGPLQHLMSLPRKRYEGPAKACCAGPVLPEREDSTTEEESFSKQADRLF